MQFFFPVLSLLVALLFCAQGLVAGMTWLSAALLPMYGWVLCGTAAATVLLHGLLDAYAGWRRLRRWRKAALLATKRVHFRVPSPSRLVRSRSRRAQLLCFPLGGSALIAATILQLCASQNSAILWLLATTELCWGCYIIPALPRAAMGLGLLRNQGDLRVWRTVGGGLIAACAVLAATGLAHGAIT